jgi:hypothetical protein
MVRRQISINSDIKPMPGYRVVTSFSIYGDPWRQNRFLFTFLLYEVLVEKDARGMRPKKTQNNVVGNVSIGLNRSASDS